MKALGASASEKYLSAVKVEAWILRFLIYDYININFEYNVYSPIHHNQRAQSKWWNTDGVVVISQVMVSARLRTDDHKQRKQINYRSVDRSEYL